MLVTSTNPFTVSIIITIDRILLLSLLLLLYFVVFAVTAGMNITLSAGNWTFCATKTQFSTRTLSSVSKPLQSMVTSLDGSGEKCYFISICIFNRRGTYPSKSRSLLVLSVLTLHHKTAISHPHKSPGAPAWLNLHVNVWESRNTLPALMQRAREQDTLLCEGFFS